MFSPTVNRIRTSLPRALALLLSAVLVGMGLFATEASAHVTRTVKRSDAPRTISLVAQYTPKGLFPQTNPHGDAVQQGINFVGWSTDAYTGTAANNSLRALASTGANWVAVVVEQYQTSADSTSIFPTSSTVSNASISSIVAQAHALHLNVTLRPLIDTLSGAYRGTIGASFTPSQWATWFASYQTYILNYAALAQRLGVQQLVIGTELEEASTHASEWLSLIKKIRRVYGGSLTYAANFGSEVESISWWGALNDIGVDAYYSLNPTEPDFGWSTYLTQLSALSRRFDNKPILFTEVGYTSMANTASEPWNYTVNSPLSLTAQSDAYQATFQAVASEPWLAGMYWWAWSPQIPNGPTDSGYSPQNKPAEQVLTSWYGGRPS
jgi:hypothetical protein